MDLVDSTHLSVNDNEMEVKADFQQISVKSENDAPTIHNTANDTVENSKAIEHKNDVKQELQEHQKENFATIEDKSNVNQTFDNVGIEVIKEKIKNASIVSEEANDDKAILEHIKDNLESQTTKDQSIIKSLPNSEDDNKKSDDFESKCDFQQISVKSENDAPTLHNPKNDITENIKTIEHKNDVKQEIQDDQKESIVTIEEKSNVNQIFDNIEIEVITDEIKNASVVAEEANDDKGMVKHEKDNNESQTNKDGFESKRDKTRKTYISAKEIKHRTNEKFQTKCNTIDVYESTELNMGTNEDGVEGRVKFFKNYLTENEATELYDCLVKDLPWQQKESVNREGEKYPEPRMTHWFGKAYKYSSVSWQENNEWHSMIADLKSSLCSDSNVSIVPGRELNSVMCNYYRDNNDSIGWHADDETSLGRCPQIASISLGHERVFEVCKREEYFSRMEKPRDDNVFSGCSILYRFHLGSGSLLCMEGSVQDNWLHRVSKEDAEMSGRINLTFRYIVDKDEELKEIEHKKKRAKARRLESQKMENQPRVDNRYYDNRWQDRYNYGNYDYDYSRHYPRQSNNGRNDSRWHNGYMNSYTEDRNGNRWYQRFNDRSERQGEPRYRQDDRQWRQEEHRYRQDDRPWRKEDKDYIQRNDGYRGRGGSTKLEDSDYRQNTNRARQVDNGYKGDSATRPSDGNYSQKDEGRRQRTVSHNELDEIARNDYQRFHDHHQHSNQRTNK